MSKKKSDMIVLSEYDDGLSGDFRFLAPVKRKTANILAGIAKSGDVINMYYDMVDENTIAIHIIVADPFGTVKATEDEVEQ